jgi:hypothetical protein
MLSYRNICTSSCESGQDAVRKAKVRRLIIAARDQFKGDFEVLRQCRRLELALEDFGWRGHVEEIIDHEEYNIDKMDGLELDDSLLESRKTRSTYLEEVRAEKAQFNLFKDKGLWDPVDVIPSVQQVVANELGTSRSKSSTRSIISGLRSRPRPQMYVNAGENDGTVPPGSSRRSSDSGLSTVSASSRSSAGRHALEFDAEDWDMKPGEDAEKHDPADPADPTSHVAGGNGDCAACDVGSFASLNLSTK